MLKKIKDEMLFLTIIPEMIWHILHNRFDDNMWSRYAKWVINILDE